MSSFNERPFKTFLSHAHVDKGVVDKIYHWLSQPKNFNVWYDGANLPSGAQIGSYLPEAIAQCQGMIIVLSKASVKSGWVKEEYDSAIGQRAKNSNFRIIPIRLEECEIPGFLETTKWIDAPNGELNFSVFDELISGFYHDNVSVNLANTRDIYISRPWREHEAAPADAVCRHLIRAGFRLIGDSPDQNQFGERRVETIMAGCGGLVAILPDRGGGSTSNYMLNEIEMARALQIPHFVFAQSSVNLPESLSGPAVRFESEDDLNAGGKNKHAILNVVETLKEEYKSPERLHHIFFSTNFANEQRNLIVSRAIERITGLPCIMGNSLNLSSKGLQEQIVGLISRSLVVIADITDEQINTCIEAGIAMGAGVRINVLAKKTDGKKPFMLRHLQIEYFDDDVSLLGVIHKLAIPYRRRVLNSELT